WARQRLVLVLTAELVVLGMGWLATCGSLASLAGGAPGAPPPYPRWLALGAGDALPAWSTAALLGAAGVLMSRAVVLRGRRARRRLAPARGACLALLAAVLPAAACQPLTGWLGTLPRLLPAALAPGGLLLYVVLAILAGFLLLAGAAALSPSSPAAA